MKRFEIVDANEEAIFRLFDDELFFNDQTRERLEANRIQEVHFKTDVDSIVCCAMDRALNITIPAGRRISNGTMKSNRGEK